MNFPHQMEQFDIKLHHFGGLNRCQQQDSLSIVEIRRPLSLSSLNQGPKNKHLYQNGIGTISRDHNCIICVIV